MAADKPPIPEEPMKQHDDLAWDAFLAEAQRLAALARSRRAAQQQEETRQI